MPTMPVQPGFGAGVVPNAAALNLLSQGVEVLSQIAIGKTASTGPTARPVVKVVRLNPLTLTTAVTTMVTWESTETNTDGMWASPAGSAVTIQTAGWYRIIGGLSYDPGTGGFADRAGVRQRQLRPDQCGRRLGRGARRGGPQLVPRPGRRLRAPRSRGLPCSWGRSRTTPVVMSCSIPSRSGARG